jgi:hypothetical protein
VFVSLEESDASESVMDAMIDGELPIVVVLTLG